MTSKKSDQIQIDNLTLIHDDCLNVLKSLPDNHIDLILTDPPYYKVKSNSWDKQWKTADDYLAWLDDIFAEFWRVLKPAGSLYVFCGPHLCAETEILIKQRFNVLNHIVWAKPNGTWLRRPFNVTKHVPYTDVWTHKPVAYYRGKHPCEKPSMMLEQIISASSKDGDLVADFFMGSGSTLKAAKKLGRFGLGVEFEEETFLKTVSEIKETTI